MSVGTIDKRNALTQNHNNPCLTEINDTVTRFSNPQGSQDRWK